MSVVNPETGAKILIGGPTYQKLVREGKISEAEVLAAEEAAPAEPMVLIPETGEKVKVGSKRFFDLIVDGTLTQFVEDVSEIRDALGNPCRRSKYSQTDAPFCGPAGGACPNTYPVNTPGRYRAALAYARNAPYPEGVRECARKVAKKKGW